MRSNRDKVLARLGVSSEWYERQLERQHGVCAICGAPPQPNKRLSVDHDHRCCPRRRSCGRCLRGLICDGCNLMLGHGRDDPEVLAKAIHYLLNPAARDKEEAA